MAADTRPILVGPWVGEVGFEVLYWVPFVRWAAQEFHIDPARLVAISRGGTAGWYRPFVGRYHEVFDYVSREEFRRFEREHGQPSGYRPIGYLLLVPADRWDAHLEGVAVQRAAGAPVEVLSLEEALRFGEFVTAGLGGATFGPADGVVDPHAVTQAAHPLQRSETMIVKRPPPPGVRFSGVPKMAFVF